MGMKNWILNIIAVLFFQFGFSQSNGIEDYDSIVSYEIKKKETLFNISKKFKINIEDIFLFNPELRGQKLKKNSKKNKFKAKDRFRNSIISNESISNNSNQEDTNKSVIAPTSVNNVSSVRVHSLGTELKLIGIIGSALVTILVITSFIL